MGAELTTAISFSRVAADYDASRVIPETVLAEMVSRLQQRTILPSGAMVLDIGCGTGQMLEIFHRQGCPVAGIDISAEMLATARARLPGADLVVASAYDLPSADNHADVVLASKLFQHLDDWTSALTEIRRVLAPGGHLVHVRDRGIFRNAVREKFGSLADARGYVRRYNGEHPLDELAPVAARAGLQRIAFDDTGMDWSTTITMGHALEQFGQRLFAEFWGIPDEEYQQILDEVTQWVEQTKPGGLSHAETRNGHLVVEVYRRASDSRG